jgi:hypothetical protein
MDRSKKPEGAPPTQTYAEARADLPSHLQPIFDALCEDVSAWSKYFYGRKLISYSILKELVLGGWRRSPESSDRDSGVTAN